MLDPLALLVLVAVLAIAFDVVNGFHDTANAIATVVATRVLTPTEAIIMSAVLNFLGALSGTAVARTIGEGIVPAEALPQAAVASALMAAIGWNLCTGTSGCRPAPATRSSAESSGRRSPRTADSA